MPGGLGCLCRQDCPVTKRHNDKLYWGDAADGIVYRSNLDGTNVETVLSGLLFGPLDIKVDTSSGYIYAAGNNPSGGGIVRSNLDGSGLETLFSGGLPTNLALATAPIRGPASAGLLAIGLLAIGFRSIFRTKRLNGLSNSAT